MIVTDLQVHHFCILSSVKRCLSNWSLLYGGIRSENRNRSDFSYEVNNPEFLDSDLPDRLSHANFTNFHYLPILAFFKVNALDETNVND